MAPTRPRPRSATSSPAAATIRPSWPRLSAATGASRTACIGFSTSPFGKMTAGCAIAPPPATSPCYAKSPSTLSPLIAAVEPAFAVGARRPPGTTITCSGSSPARLMREPWGSVRVADALHTPIAGYETELGLYGFRELIRRGAVDIVQVDVAWSGGFSEGKRIAAYAGAHHRMVAPHAFAGAVLLLSSLHYAASVPNALVLEWDQNQNALRDELLKEPLKLESDGTVRLPERPGLGIELDRAAVERYRVG